MAKVLFINPVVKEEDNPYHVPMGIAQLAAVVMKLNHQVQVFDLNAWRVGGDKIKEVLSSDNWDLIAVGGITTSYSSIKKIVKMCRKIFTKTPICLGGGVLTSLPKEMMTWLPEIDFGIIGESYQTLPDVLSMIDEKKK